MKMFGVERKVTSLKSTSVKEVYCFFCKMSLPIRCIGELRRKDGPT